MENWMKVVLAIVLAAGLGYASGRYMLPAKVQIETKEVTKEVTVVKHDTITETHEVKRPDGTIITDTTVKNRDTSQSNTTESKKSDTKISNEKPQWRAQGLIGVGTRDLAQIAYGVGIERRILGPVFVGAWGLAKPSEQTIGLSVSVEF